jgi:hypothetical protein
MNKLARLDSEGTAIPLTRIVHHPPSGIRVGPHTMLHEPEYEGARGERITLIPPPVEEIGEVRGFHEVSRPTKFGPYATSNLSQGYRNWGNVGHTYGRPRVKHTNECVSYFGVRPRFKRSNINT